MKLYRWGCVAAGVMTIMVAAALFDWSAWFVAQRHVAGGTAGLPAGDQSALHACDGDSAAYLGPLVPGQKADSQEETSEAIPQAQSLPPKALSMRAGFGVSTPTEAGYWATLLGSGWYLDWSVLPEAPPAGLDHWQMVRVHETCISPSPEAIRSAAALSPGQVWVIGNEPDVIWQDNVTADRYAVLYHELYELIKAGDPSALIAVGGVSQPTPLRLHYLDQVLETHQRLYHEPMPVDWWTVHGYVLREEQGSWGVGIPPGIEREQGELRQVSDHGRLDLFSSQLRAFRQWMADRGYQDTPLALTEFGLLMPSAYGFPPEMVAGYLEQTFVWLMMEKDGSIGYPQDDYRLVQRWAWFSISDPTYFSSNLGDLSSGKLTLIGERFRDTVTLMLP